MRTVREGAPIQVIEITVELESRRATHFESMPGPASIAKHQISPFDVVQSCLLPGRLNPVEFVSSQQQHQSPLSVAALPLLHLLGSDSSKRRLQAATDRRLKCQQNRFSPDFSF